MYPLLNVQSSHFALEINSINSIMRMTHRMCAFESRFQLTHGCHCTFCATKAKLREIYEGIITFWGITLCMLVVKLRISFQLGKMLSHCPLLVAR